MEFRLLGPLEVAEDGHPVSLGGSRVRALLALLLVHRNEVLAVDRIVDELWGGQPPKTAEQVVRVYVSQLRKALEPDVLLTRPNGYLLKVAPEDVDSDRFDALRAEGRRQLAAGDAAQAADTLDEALSLWRGRPLQDFAYEPFAEQEIARLEELRLATLEDRFDAQLATGHDTELVADLEQLVDANPLRERLRAQLMLALYRSGRQADALEAYQRGRRLLVDELGLEPSEPLRRLETQILQQDPQLDRPSVSPLSVETPSRPPRSRRRAVLAITVTVIAIAVIAGFLIAATRSRGARRSITSLRVTLVQDGPRSLAETPPVGAEPVDGLRAAAEDLGVQTKVVYAGYRLSHFLRDIAAAARSSDLVIVGATPNLQAVSKLTRRLPNTRFLVPDTLTDPYVSWAGQKNVTGMNFDDRENGYLGGYLTGLMAKGHKTVSAVGGIKTDSVRGLIAGFKAGVQRARPGIRVLVTYTRTFVDQQRCEAAANQQINRGSFVVFDVAGECGFGALDAARIRGKWGLGVDEDLSYLGSFILASVVKRLDRATQLAVTLFASGELPGGQDLRLDLASDSIGLAGINTRVPQAVRAKLLTVEARFRARDQARDSR